MTNIINTNTMVGKLVAVFVALLLVVVLVYPVINTVGGGSTGINIDNEGAEWLKLGYAEGTDFEFVITDDGADVTVGEQTGSLGDMIYYADENRVIFSKGTTMYLMTTGNDSAVYTFNDSVSVTNSNGTITIYDGSAVIDTASSPAWAYYPDASGGYGFFTNGNLNLLVNEPKVAVGSYAGVFAYNDTIVTPDDVDLGLVMTGDYATGDVTWAVSSDEESNDEPAVQPLASQPTMVTMSKYTEISVMGSANPSGATKIGDLYYTFSGSNATVVGYSSSIDWSTFTTIPDTVEYNSTTYTITSIGISAFYGCTNLALTSLPSGVTSIKTNAFYGCTNLALTSLPSGVTSIGHNAFQGCTNLALTSLPAGLTSIEYSAFYGCTNLALTSLPSGVTSIANSVFYGCTNLALTSLHSGVTSIEQSAFYGCTNLALTSLPAGVTSIGHNAFNECTSLALTSLPSGVTSIGSGAFQGCTNLALTSLPSGVTSIGNYAFQGCTNLALTSLPSGVRIISNNAFQGCTNLALTSLPAGLTSIGTSAFQGCTSLTTLSILGSPTIGNNAFQDCTNLKTIYNYGTTPITTTSYGLNADRVLNMVGVLGYTFDSTTSTATVTGYAPSIDWTTFTSIPNTVIYGGTTYTVTGIGTEAFKNCTNLALTSLPSGLTSIEVSTFQGCTNLALTSLPNGVTNIGQSAFSGCTNLALTSLPSGVTSISNSAFFGCTSLALTSLPSGLTSIGNYTFFGCTSLALTSLPSGVTSIGISAFNGCTSLALTSLPSGVTSIGSGAFQGCSGIKSMIFLGSPTIENNAFFNTGIKEVLNLGEAEITATAYGLNADSVQDYVSALGYVAPTHIQEGSSDSSGYNMDSVSMAVFKIVPIILMVCILLVLVMPMINGKAQ